MKLLLVPDAGTPGPPPDKNTSSEFEILNGGVSRDLNFTVGGKKEVRSTLIKKVSIRDMAPLGRSWGQVKKEAEVYIGASAEVIEQLDDESFETVISEGRRLNFTALSKWLNWQSETLKAFGQSSQFDELITDAMNRVLGTEPRQ